MYARKPAVLPQSAAAIAALAFLLAAACTDETNVGPQSLRSITISVDSLYMAVGQSRSVKAIPLDLTGAALFHEQVFWATGDVSVASVTARGRVTALAVGRTTLRATASGVEASVPVTVEAPRIETDPPVVVLRAPALSTVEARSQIAVSNGGPGELRELTHEITYLDQASDWLAVTVVVVDPNTFTLDLVASPEGLAVGVHDARLTLSSSSAGRSETVDVSLSVEIPVLASVSECTDAALCEVVPSPVTIAAAIHPSVLVTDQFGRPMSNVEVRFKVASGGGRVSGEVATTDDNGLARVGEWELGVTPGLLNELVATASHAELTASTTLHVRPENLAANQPARLERVAWNPQIGIVGEHVSPDPSVRVRDIAGTALGGTRVDFSATAGGGTSVGQADTDMTGAATVQWTLGDASPMQSDGTFANRLEARVSSVPSALGNVLTFDARARYSCPTHIRPIFDGYCGGCHGVNRFSLEVCDSTADDVQEYLDTLRSQHQNGFPYMPDEASKIEAWIAWLRHGTPNN